MCFDTNFYGLFVVWSRKEGKNAALSGVKTKSVTAFEQIHSKNATKSIMMMSIVLEISFFSKIFSSD